MELHVNPAKCSCRIVDPLHSDASLCEQIGQHTQQEHYRGPRLNNVQGVPPEEINLMENGAPDLHRTKTLVREMVQMVKGGCARVVKGTLPSLADVDKLPGDYLLNPNNQLAVNMPKFEKDYPAWVDRLGSQSG